MSLHSVVCFLTLLLCTLYLMHSRGSDWLSAARVQRDTVFISLAFCVCLWSVSCWLKVNVQQHLITSLGFCLKGHKGPVCDCESNAGTDVKLTEGPLTAILFLKPLRQQINLNLWIEMLIMQKYWLNYWLTGFLKPDVLTMCLDLRPCVYMVYDAAAMM